MEQEQKSVPVGPSLEAYGPTRSLFLANNLPERIAPFGHPHQISARVSKRLGVFVGYHGDGRRAFVWDEPTMKELYLPPPGGYGPPPPPGEWEHAQADKAGEFGFVYFIGGDVGAIKIGRSVDVVARLRSLQLSSPIPLRVLATRKGGDARERAYHAQFADSRLHGEWFKRHPDILAEIDRLNGPRP